MSDVLSPVGVAEAVSSTVIAGLVLRLVVTKGAEESGVPVGALPVGALPVPVVGPKSVKVPLVPGPQVSSERHTCPWGQQPAPHGGSSGPHCTSHMLGGTQSTPCGQHMSKVGHFTYPSMVQGPVVLSVVPSVSSVVLEVQTCSPLLVMHGSPSSQQKSPQVV